ncbi:hypothetical protein [Rhizobium sp. BK068]|uniref:hypothetical protein n=1 Tax=Rhizobium sp. BK068 TaxID=2512130 RepID=UPI0010E7B974|nr:hypothetical protein [Rhizobium sp. BK068]TCM59490.1 hypothetical protein EV291_1832 [Rhizobium sp. BK068]
METARLGKTGLEVSRICFGCMSFGKQTDDLELTTDDIKKLEVPYKPLHVGGF